MQQDGEPSVEEILDSIKKVIARDNREAASVQRRQRESDGVVEFRPVEAEEVLELSAEAELVDDEVSSDQSDAEPLIAKGPRESMHESFAALAMLAQPGAAPQIVRSGETSLEGMAREMLRPMLADWLDKNLPNMVETLVAAEISKIAGKKG